MPAATVEVISPDLEIVDRVWLTNGGSAEVAVPSEASFLLVHLPSGQVVTLQDPGNLNRTINLDMLLKKESRRSQRGVTLPRWGNTSTFSVPLGGVPEIDEAFETQEEPAEMDGTTLAGDISIRMRREDEQVSPVFRAQDGRSAKFTNVRSLSPVNLEILTPTNQLSVHLPGILTEARVNVFNMKDNTLLITIQARLGHAIANTLGGYMARGDFDSAAAMSSWADTAEQLLFGKMDDPFAATIGAYLLLRIRQFDLMRTWARNLADRFPSIPDGSVIWAWQLIHQRGSENEIRDYLARVASGTLPVFTEGIKLLRDGLRLLGKGEQELQRQVQKKTANVFWESPFTALLDDPYPEIDIRFDVAFGGEV
jgi:hypothetical protein